MANAEVVGRRSMVVPRLMVMVGAVLAAVVVWAVATLALDVDLRSPGFGASMPAQTIELVWVILVPVIVSLAGWGLLALLERTAPARAGRIWTVTAIVVLLLSLAAPLTGTGVTAASRVTMISLHIVVGLVLIVGLNRQTRVGR